MYTSSQNPTFVASSLANLLPYLACWAATLSSRACRALSTKRSCLAKAASLLTALSFSLSLPVSSHCLLKSTYQAHVRVKHVILLKVQQPWDPGPRCVRSCSSPLSCTWQQLAVYSCACFAAHMWCLVRRGAWLTPFIERWKPCLALACSEALLLFSAKPLCCAKSDDMLGQLVVEKTAAAYCAKLRYCAVKSPFQIQQCHQYRHSRFALNSHGEQHVWPTQNAYLEHGHIWQCERLCGLVKAGNDTQTPLSAFLPFWSVCAGFSHSRIT